MPRARGVLGIAGGLGSGAGRREGALQKRLLSQICMTRTGQGAPEGGAANAEAGEGKEVARVSGSRSRKSASRVGC